MSRNTILMFVLTVIIIVYICFALPFTHTMASEARMSNHIDIVLSDPDSKFVNVSDVMQELNVDPEKMAAEKLKTFDIATLEKRLRDSDKLQSANITLTTDGRLQVYVEPMVPVARVFDTTRPSYYINASGKRISADVRYHIDVPVLVGTFGSEYPAQRLLPLLDYISSDPSANAMVATVTQEADGNIILVPTIVGHVINFGDTSMVADKFMRLRAFYRHIAPTKGWNTYDTVAVKWRDRVVATRRNKEMPPVAVPTEDEMTGALDIADNEPSPEDINPEILADQKRTLP